MFTSKKHGTRRLALSAYAKGTGETLLNSVNNSALDRKLKPRVCLARGKIFVHEFYV